MKSAMGDIFLCSYFWSHIVKEWETSVSSFPQREKKKCECLAHIWVFAVVADVQSLTVLWFGGGYMILVCVYIMSPQKDKSYLVSFDLGYFCHDSLVRGCKILLNNESSSCQIVEGQMYWQSNDYLLVLLSAGLGLSTGQNDASLYFQGVRYCMKSWIKKIEFNVYETNLDWYTINACIGSHYLVCPLNVACAMAFSKCDCFRFMIFFS